MRKVAVRTAEMPVGNLVVDAMFEAAVAACVPGDPARPCPVAALENAGGIRNTTACGERQVVPAGTLFEKDADDMLPFATNQLVVVNVTGEELWLMLEHSATLLGQVGEPILGREAKLAALEEAVARFNITFADTLAVGDGANDLDMIKRAGLGVAYHAKPVVAAAAGVAIAHSDLTALLYLQGYRAAEIIRS